MQSTVIQKISELEYLKQELQAQSKSEYHHGEVLAMAGASEAHVLIVTNLVREISQCLKELNCRVYSTDRLLHVPDCDSYYYPDLMLVCGDSQIHQKTENIDAILNPQVIIEVLSDSTRAFDLSEKFRCYQQIPSLEQYILVEQDSLLVESYQKQTIQNWNLQIFNQKKQKVRILDCEILLQEIYDKVSLKK